MMDNTRRGVLAISIDLDLRVDRPHRSDPQVWERVTESLLRLFDEFHVPATWAVADPGRSPVSEMIRRSPVAHEVAILGDRTWVGRGAGRTRFARELERRVKGAESSGLNVSTLALRDVELCENLDLLVKQRIAVVSGGQASPDAQSAFRPRSQRFGVWDAPASCRLPGTRYWWWSSGEWHARRAIRRAVDASDVVHLLVDGPQLVENEGADLLMIARVLHFANRLHDQGLLVIDTLGQLARKLTQPQPMPCRSVLARAA